MEIVCNKVIIPNKDFNIQKMYWKCTALPLEIPSLVSLDFYHQDPTIKKLIQGLKPIIGFFPYVEQQHLFQRLRNPTSSGETLFNSDIMSFEVIRKEQQSLSEMLTANAKRFRVGLGCLQQVSTQFASIIQDLDWEYTLLGNVYKDNQDMLHASNQLNHCQKDFHKILFLTLNKRKEILNQITTTNFATPDFIDYFIRNKEGLISGIRYNDTDITDIVNGFKQFSICQQSFNNIIHQKGLKNIFAITQFVNCKDYRVNPNSGKSTQDYENASFNYKDKEMIGINKGQGIRSDKRTQNNYLLNTGFGLKNNNNWSNPFIISISNEWEQKIKKTREFAKINHSRLESKLDDFSNKTPFADLLYSIFEMANSNMYILKRLLSNQKEQCTKSYIIECSTNCVFSLISNNIGITQEQLQAIDLNPKPAYIFDNKSIYNKNFVMTSQYIAIVCNNNKLSVYSEGYNPISGTVYDYYEDNQSLGAVNAEASQSCSGVFTSGGKNDKDACRSVINKQCGNTLDYKCKASGFFDVINQNPPAKTILPNECRFTETDGTGTHNNLDCFNYISKHFILGTLSIKPSSFLSYSMSAQIEGNGGQLQIPQYFNEPNYIDEIKISSYPPFSSNNIVDESLFYVEGNVLDKFTDDGKLNVNLDQTPIQYSFSKYIYCSLFILLTITLY